MPTLTKRATKWWTSLVLLGVAACGCQAPTIPNPNDPEDVGLVTPDVLRTNLSVLYQFLADRVARGEITQKKADQYMAEEAEKMVRHVDIKRVPKGMVWEYADIYRTARDWKRAREAYRLAVENAKNEDRRINDTLRLAQCAAAEGDVKEAINLAKSVMNAKPVDSAPILPGVYLEIVPMAEGKGHDGDLADLVVQAVKKHKETVVDSKKPEGQAFLMARSYHIRKALQKAYDLYMSAGKKDKAQACLKIPVPEYLPAMPPGMSKEEFFRQMSGGRFGVDAKQGSKGYPLPPDSGLP